MGAEQEQLWVLRARKGDQEAFARLVAAYQVPVYNLAFRMLGSPAEAEDAAQDTFLKMYARLDTYDPSFKFSSWVLSIASHHCVDKLRRRHGHWESVEDEDTTLAWVADERPKPEEETLEREQSASIRQMLEHLSPQYRLVIVLRYWHDLSYEEIAEVTQSTESAIKSRLHRAREMMAQIGLRQGGGASHV